MGALGFSVVKRIKNYISYNIKYILIGGAFFLLMFSIFMGTYTHDPDFEEMKALNLGLTELNGITILITSVLLGISMFFIDNIPITKAESNFYFITPIKENTVVIYLYLKSLIYSILPFFGFMYLDLSILMPIFNLELSETFVLIFTQMLTMMVISSFSLFLLCLKFKNALISEIIKYGTILICFFVIGITFYKGFADFQLNQDFLKAAQTAFKYLVDSIFGKFPIFINSVILNDFLYNGNIIGILISIFTIFIFIIISVKMKIKLSDKAFDLAVVYEKRRKNKKNLNEIDFKFLGKKSVQKSEKIRGKGASAIFYKNLLEQRRKNPFFINSQVLYYILFLVLYSVMLSFIGTFDEDLDFKNYVYYLCILLCMYVVSLFPKKYVNEINLPIYILLPVDNFKKIMISVFSANLDNFFGSIITFIFCLIVKIPIVDAVLLSIIYIFITASCIFIDSSLQTLFENPALTLIKHATSVIAKLIFWGIIVAGIAFSMNLTESIFVAFTVVSLICIISDIISVVVIKIKVSGV